MQCYYVHHVFFLGGWMVVAIFILYLSPQEEELSIKIEENIHLKLKYFKFFLINYSS